MKTADTATDTSPRPISFATAKVLIGCIITDLPVKRPRTAMVYGHFYKKADCITTSNRVDAVLLAHLRSGHTLFLKAFAHLLDSAADPLCPLCKEEQRTLEYWLQRCPNFDVLRQPTCSCPSPPRGVLVNDPEKVPTSISTTTNLGVVALTHVTVG